MALRANFLSGSTAHLTRRRPRNHNAPADDVPSIPKRLAAKLASDHRITAAEHEEIQRAIAEAKAVLNLRNDVRRPVVIREDE